MKIQIHQTRQTIGDFAAIFDYLKVQLTQAAQRDFPSLHIFPELFLTGYPLQDLCLQREFIQNYHQLLEEINSLSTSLPENDDLFLLGGLNYLMNDHSGLPEHIFNVIFHLQPGKPLKAIYTKQLLPNYDIFDEKKYFTPGNQAASINFQGHEIALLICEDMWTSKTYACDPITQLKNLDKNFDLIVNLSASPFHVGKHPQRIKRAKEIAQFLQAPFFYVNRVGAEDEIIFDGGSFVTNGQDVVTQLPRFKAVCQTVDLPTFKPDKNTPTTIAGSSWDALFNASLNNEKTPPQLLPLSDQDCALILDALCFSIQEYAAKSGFSKFTIALSGGIDSSLVLAIVKKSLKPGQYLEAIYMPGLFSASMSYDLSAQLCHNLQVPMSTLPIKFTHKAVRNLFQDSFDTPLTGIADENIQSRLRGAFLYARSNQINSMVLNTSNKSEIAVGYSTQYGDSVGALSVLGDLYKSEVFTLSNYINRTYGEIIPQAIIDRPPSAELKENQQDSQSLPPYPILDAILESLLSYRHSVKDLLENSFKPEDVKRAFSLLKRAEFKRQQFCPIIKIKQKSFGFGYRNPICKKL